jgi:rhamnosyltransferase subunit B
MAHFLLCPSGSHGDVHPFMAVGTALQARGHRVGMSTSAHFETLARQAGFEFDAVGTEADFQATILNPNLWDTRKSFQVLFGGPFPRMLRENYRHIQSRYRPGETVLVAGVLAAAARIAHDSLGAPLATVHLQPSVLMSVSDPPVLPMLHPRRWWPRWWIRFIYWFSARFVADPLLGPPVNALRAELGLPPLRGVWKTWGHSPQCILGMFPEWFASARDWPPHLTCPGFVRYDQSDAMKLSPEVEAFLNAGEPPIAISFGSAMRTGRRYFEVAIEACQRVGKRGVILARGGEQIPTLPFTILHVDYAPFSLVFPRAAAVIHHGGIGTCAQALAAGVPQLVMPLAFDQFDNADRLLKLGVARCVPAKKFTARRAARALDELFADAAMPMKCLELKEKMHYDPLPRIVEILESLVGRDSNR